MKPYDLDETGEKILEILAADGKSSVKDIAMQTGLREELVQEYISKLEEDRIILGYNANINWQRVKHNEVKALIEVKVTPERNVGFDSVAESIYLFSEVKAVTLISGSYDLLVQVDGLDLREVAFFVSEKLATIRGVESTTTHFMLKKYKEDGVILVDHAQSKRLPVTP